ncbi:putative Trans-1,2-dihydrobenzene-1,2-diol dehydrogenase, partial [Hypsibius exemplaris]
QITQSFEVDLPNTANIYGTKGTITIPKPFHCPTELIVGGRRDTFNLPSVGHKLEYQNSEGMVFQAEEVRNCINKGLLESALMTHQESVTIATIMEEVEKQLGMTFEDLY